MMRSIRSKSRESASYYTYSPKDACASSPLGQRLPLCQLGLLLGPFRALLSFGAKWDYLESVTDEETGC